MLQLVQGWRLYIGSKILHNPLPPLRDIEHLATHSLELRPQRALIKVLTQSTLSSLSGPVNLKGRSKTLHSTDGYRIRNLRCLTVTQLERWCLPRPGPRKQHSHLALRFDPKWPFFVMSGEKSSVYVSTRIRPDSWQREVVVSARAIEPVESVNKKFSCFGHGCWCGKTRPTSYPSDSALRTEPLTT